MGIGVLASHMALLDIFLGIVPGSAGIGHEHGKHEACAEAAEEQSEDTGDAQYDSREDRYYDGDERRDEHLVLGRLCRYLHAAAVVRRALPREDALDLAELPAHLQHHLGSGTPDGIHRKAAEKERHHSSEEYSRKQGRIHYADNELVKHVKDGG